ncbi:TPA: ash family protein [Salmonella enterica subsp. salamae serovar 21:z10:[z6]]
MSGQQKKSLNAVIAGCYIFPAITVLMVGHTTPCNTKATKSAACAFFIVVTTLFAVKRQIMAWCMLFSACRAAAVTHKGVHHTTMSMVAQAGPTSVGPVSFVSGSGIPVWAIASEHTTSSDRPLIKHKGDRCYAQPPQKSHPKSDHHPPTQLRLPP